jgi:hypothetical protein
MFEVKEKLGKGAFATVYKGHLFFFPFPPNHVLTFRLGVHKESGFILAIKDIENIDDDEELKKEIDILKVFLFFLIDVSEWESILGMPTPKYCMLLRNLRCRWKFVDFNGFLWNGIYFE